MAENSETSYKDKILGFLKRFEWEPDSVKENDGNYTIVLVAELDIKEVKISIKFSEEGLWIYFSSLFLPQIKKNRELIYAKLLQLNYSTTLTKFGISSMDNGGVYTLIELPLKTLDYEEFTSALRRLTNDINTYLIPIASLLQKD